MRKRVFIIHGWQGSPDEGWFPWLRKELVAMGYEVAVPPMPDPDEPSIEQWLSFLAEQVGTCDADIYFVGHSLGAQAILRYLQRQQPMVRCGGAVFAAGFETLYPDDPESQRALAQWLREPIHWESIRGRTKNFVALFSDNDPYVPLDNVRVFDEKLEAKTILLHARGHMGANDGASQPEVLEELLQMLELPHTTL